MTEAPSLSQPGVADTNGVAKLEEALAVIDRGLGEMMRRDLVATAEVADLLLDLRSILTFVPADPAVEPAAVN